MRSIAETSGSQILSPKGELALRRLDHEQHNLRAAVEWSLGAGDPSVGLAVLGITWRWFQQRGRLREGRAWLAELLAMHDAEVEPKLRLGALSAEGGLAYWMEDFEGARSAYRERLELAEATGDPRLIADANYDIGFLFAVSGEPEKLRSYETRSIELYRSLGDDGGIDRAEQALVLAAFLDGEYAAAKSISEKHLAKFRERNSHFQVADTLTLLSGIEFRLGDPVRSWRRVQEGLAIFSERDAASGIARALGMTGLLQVRWGDGELGARIVGATLELQREKNVMIAPTRVLHLPEPAELATERLGPERATALFAEGAAIPVHDMIDMILAIDPEHAFAHGRRH
jgi:tetratricopeptide (TPR) repeat protein